MPQSACGCQRTALWNQFLLLGFCLFVLFQFGLVLSKTSYLAQHINKQHFTQNHVNSLYFYVDPEMRYRSPALSGLYLLSHLIGPGASYSNNQCVTHSSYLYLYQIFIL